MSGNNGAWISANIVGQPRPQVITHVCQHPAPAPYFPYCWVYIVSKILVVVGFGVADILMMLAALGTF